MSTHQAVCLEFPDSNPAPSCDDYSFIFDPEAEVPWNLVESRRLNLLASTVRKQSEDRTDRLHIQLARRRFVARLIDELFPLDLNHREVTFFYEAELKDDRNGLHFLFFGNPTLWTILTNVSCLETVKMTDLELAEMRGEMLQLVDHLVPSDYY